MATLRFLLLTICFLVLCKLSLCQQCSHPKCSLMQNLTRSYLKDMLPDCPGSEFPVNVGMQILLRQVVDLDEPRQILTTSVWVRMKWNDCRLRWNPADHNGIEVLYFPFGSIWTPDVTLYDDSAFGSNIALSERKFYILEVNSTGQVKQKFPTLLKSVCGVDTTYFPFDKQICPLKFGPWVYDYPAVNLSTYSEDGKDEVYIENAEWVLEGIKSETTITRYSRQSFTEVIYFVEIQRRPVFFMLTLFFPCILISTMAVIGFFLPPSSSQKVGLQLTLLLSLTVFQFLTLGLMPPNSKPLPLMCIYFALVMVLASISCLLSVLVMKIHMKGAAGWKVSKTLKTLLIDKLGRLLLLKRPHILREHAKMDLSKNQTSDNANRRLSTQSHGLSPTPTPGGLSTLSVTLEETGSTSDMDLSKNQTNDDANRRLSTQSDGLSPSPTPGGLSTLSVSLEETGSSSDPGVVINSFQKVAERLSKLIEHIEEEKIKHESAEFQDWATIASVLDRLFLILHFVLSLSVSCIFLFKLLL